VEPNWVHSALRPPMWPIVPAPGDYDNGKIGEIIGKHQITPRKPAPMPLCPPQIPHAYSDANPGRRGGKAAPKLLNYGTAAHKGLEPYVCIDR
jgi:hypothetical protein